MADDAGDACYMMGMFGGDLLITGTGVLPRLRFCRARQVDGL